MLMIRYCPGSVLNGAIAEAVEETDAEEKVDDSVVDADEEDDELAEAVGVAEGVAALDDCCSAPVDATVFLFAAAIPPPTPPPMPAPSITTTTIANTIQKVRAPSPHIREGFRGGSWYGLSTL